MTIEKFRAGFWAALIVALTATLVAFPTPLFLAAAALLVIFALLTSQLENSANRALAALSLLTVGVAGAIIAVRLGVTEPSLLVLAGLVAVWITILVLVGAWNRARTIYYGYQLVIGTLFGPRIINGPARLVYLPQFLGRITAVIPLREQKSAVTVYEIDTHESRDRTTTMRIVRDGEEELSAPMSLMPERIHSLDLVVTYRIDGPNWVRLYSIPGAEQMLKKLEQGGDGPRLSRDQPEIWARLAEAYIREESDELLRSVIFNRHWTAAEVSEQRVIAAEALQAELGAEAAAHGILVERIELQRVAVDSLDSVRAARDIAVRSSGRAEEVERVGRALIDLQMQFLRRLQGQLRNGLRQADFEIIVRNQLRELSYQAWRHGWLDQFEDNDPPRRRHGAA